jgi:vitamin B12 transporter
MSSRFAFSFFAFVAALAPLASAAAEDIIVTGARLRTPLDASATTVRVLTAADLERRQAKTLADALQAVPGFTLSRNGAFGGQTTLRLRGASSSQTLVLVDGVALNDPSSPNGGFDAATLDAAEVERVEVLSGPQSTLWGSDAIGGVINIVTRGVAPGRTGRAFAEAGSFGTARAGGSAGFASGGFGARLGGFAEVSDGISKADKRDGNPEADDYSAYALNGRAGYDFGPGARLEGSGRYAHSDVDTDSFGFRTGVTDGPDRARQTERSGGASLRLGGEDAAFTNRFSFSAADIDRTNFSSFGNFDAKGERVNARYEGQAKIGARVRTAFGAERERTRVRGGGAMTIDSGFALVEARPVDALTFTAGVRRDDHSRFGGVTTGRVGFLFEPVNGIGVRANWGEGFKAPTIFQLLGDGQFVQPNPALRPERARGWDAALVGHWLDGRARADVTWFRIESRDLIGFGSVGYVNIARARSEGIEATGALDVSRTLTFNGAWSQIDAVDEANGRRLLRVPENTGFLEADWRATPRLGLTLTGRHVGEAREISSPANPRRRIASWSRLDAAARFALTPRVDLYGRVENVTDAHYQEVFGYGTPGRAAYAGVRVRFE